MYTKDELAIIVLDSMLGIEYKHKINILAAVKRPSDLFDKEAAGRVAFSVIGENKANTVASAFNDDYAGFILEKCEKRGTKVITKISEGYPSEYVNVFMPPLCLYCNGDERLLSKDKKFAIVGSRKCSPEMLALTTDFAAEISSAGGIIVTGSAGGADIAAIKGSLDSGSVISVVAGGIDHVYPEFNRRLIEKVENSALVISEQPPEYEVKPWLFPMRNRLIAGLSKGVLITGGKLDSGARHTATFALDDGKEVFAFPYPPRSAIGALCNSLIKNSGAALCDDVNDILSFLGLERKEEEKTELEGDELSVFKLIKEGVEDADAILEKTGMKMFELAPVLTSLELQGLIVKLSGNSYKAV